MIADRKPPGVRCLSAVFHEAKSSKPLLERSAPRFTVSAVLQPAEATPFARRDKCSQKVSRRSAPRLAVALGDLYGQTKPNSGWKGDRPKPFSNKMWYRTINTSLQNRGDASQGKQ